MLKFVSKISFVGMIHLNSHHVSTLATKQLLRALIASGKMSLQHLRQFSTRHCNVFDPNIYNLIVSHRLDIEQFISMGEKSLHLQYLSVVSILILKDKMSFEQYLQLNFWQVTGLGPKAICLISDGKWTFEQFGELDELQVYNLNFGRRIFKLIQNDRISFTQYKQTKSWHLRVINSDITSILIESNILSVEQLVQLGQAQCERLDDERVVRAFSQGLTMDDYQKMTPAQKSILCLDTSEQTKSNKMLHQMFQRNIPRLLALSEQQCDRLKSSAITQDELVDKRWGWETYCMRHLMIAFCNNRVTKLKDAKKPNDNISLPSELLRKVGETLGANKIFF